jgi:predicted ATP-dependent endonuclease of OLD family
MLAEELRKIWERLGNSKRSYRYFLEEVRIKGLRGINDLRIPFDYPVSVLAGPNACGKTTVLFAVACAYKQPGEITSFTPALMLKTLKLRKEILFPIR